MNWTKRQERIRLDIIKDLIKYDLLTCRPISSQRPTVHLTRVLPDDPTMLDLDCTHVSFFDATTSRVEAM